MTETKAEARTPTRTTRLSLLSEKQQRVADRVVDEEESKRAHVVITLTGAHAYGFPSPDSDLDLKALHITPTSRLLGLMPGKPTFDRLEVIDGVEIDYTSNELHMILLGLLQGNGNYFERVLSRMNFLQSAELGPLQELAQRTLSKRVVTHYRGFATGQLREAEKTPQTPAKSAPGPPLSAQLPPQPAATATYWTPSS